MDNQKARQVFGKTLYKSIVLIKCKSDFCVCVCYVYVIHVPDVIQTCSTAVSTVVVSACYANLALGYLQDMKANLKQEQWGRNNGIAN